MHAHEREANDTVSVAHTLGSGSTLNHNVHKYCIYIYISVYLKGSKW